MNLFGSSLRKDHACTYKYLAGLHWKLEYMGIIKQKIELPIPIYIKNRHFLLSIEI